MCVRRRRSRGEAFLLVLLPWIWLNRSLGTSPALRLWSWVQAKRARERPGVFSRAGLGNCLSRIARTIKQWLWLKLWGAEPSDLTTGNKHSGTWTFSLV